VKKLLILCALLLVLACHERRPPAPTPEQSRELNDADDMLNGMASNEQAPEANESVSK
jgi:hypothetical protein